VDLILLRTKFHGKVCHVRNIHNLLISDNFKISYSKASDKEKEEVLQAIDKLDKYAIKQFIKVKMKEATPFEQMSLRKLRVIAKRYNIPYYYVLEKQILVNEIEKIVASIKKASEAKRNRRTEQPSIAQTKESKR